MVDKKQDLAEDFKKLQYAFGENWFVPYGKGTYVKKNDWTDDNKLGDNLFKDLVATATGPIFVAVGGGILAAVGALMTGCSLLIAVKGLFTLDRQEFNKGLTVAAMGVGYMLLAVPMAILTALIPIARVLNMISRSLATVAGCSVSADNVVPSTPVIDNPKTLGKLAAGSRATYDAVISEAEQVVKQLELPMTTDLSANLSKSAVYKDALRTSEEVELKEDNNTLRKNY